eukprot:scaffold100531_cov56-Attheya_sp.AAC.2
MQLERVFLMSQKWFGNLNGLHHGEHDVVIPQGGSIGKDHEMDRIGRDFFGMISRLIAIVHPYNTQRNESLNSLITWYAPKNRTYSCSMSLENRISIAVGVSILGYKLFWERVYSKLEVPMPISTKEWLRTRQANSVQ